MRVHPECEKGCTHHLVPDTGGRIVQRSISKGSREESEAILRRKYPDLPIAYLGVSAEHLMHIWRLGGRPWKPAASANRTEGKQGVREVKAEYRQAVWPGTGQVGPVDFTRPSDPEQQPFPAPLMTSDDELRLAVSQPANALLSMALVHGWLGVVTQAKGHVPHATHGRPSAQAKYSEAVRLHRGRQRAVAVRCGGTWASLWTWSDAVFFTRHATLEAFKQAIAQAVQEVVDNRGADCGW